MFLCVSIWLWSPHPLGFFWIEPFNSVKHKHFGYVPDKFSRVEFLSGWNCPVQKNILAWLNHDHKYINKKTRNRLHTAHLQLYAIHCHFTQLQCIFIKVVILLMVQLCLPTDVCSRVAASPFLCQSRFLFLAPLGRTKPHVCQCVWGLDVHGPSLYSVTWGIHYS